LAVRPGGFVFLRTGSPQRSAAFGAAPALVLPMNKFDGPEGPAFYGPPHLFFLQSVTLAFLSFWGLSSLFLLVCERFLPGHCVLRFRACVSLSSLSVLDFLPLPPYVSFRLLNGWTPPLERGPAILRRPLFSSPLGPPPRPSRSLFPNKDLPSLFDLVFRLHPCSSGGIEQ